MTQIRNQITSLPFYTNLKYQDRNKWWVQSLYRLISPNQKFLPFQIQKDITEIGGVECPIPSSIDYTADFSTTTDGWEYETILGDIDITLSVSGGRLIADVTNNIPGVDYAFKLKKKVTNNFYQYNSSIINSVVDAGSGSAQLVGLNIPGGDLTFPSSTFINGGYSINESLTIDNRTQYIQLIFSDALSLSTQYYIDSITTSSTPYKLYNENNVYNSDFSTTTDGWVIKTSGTASINNISNKLVLTYNTDTLVLLSRDLLYSNDNINSLNIVIDADKGILNSFRISGKNKSGGSVNRFISAQHDFTNGIYTYNVDNIDQWAEFNNIELNLRPNGEIASEISSIKFDVLVDCIATQTDIWQSAQLIELETGAITDIASYMNANTALKTYSNYQVAIYDASVNLPFLLLSKFYYLKLNDGLQDYYSEVFLSCSDLSEYIKIEWWRDTDLIFNSGRIVYEDGFINTMYIESDLGKPQNLVEIEETVRSGYKFVEKATTLKRFNFDAIVPEVIVNILSRLYNHEYITIVENDLTYNVNKIDVLEADWEEHGDLAVLPIEFETDNIISSGTNISQVVNELFANDSEAINIRGNNKRIFQLNDTLDYTDIFIAADKSTLTEAVRIRLSDLPQITGGSKENISTGIQFGGELSINTDNTKFDIEAGKAIIVNSYTDPENPTFTVVEWDKQTGIAVTNIATQLVTYVRVNSSGQFIQTANSQTVTENRDSVELGLLVHTNQTNLTKATNITFWQLDSSLTLSDLTNAIGRINTEGCIFSANGANLNINRSSGITFGNGGNYAGNKKSPNFISSPAENNINFLHVYGGSPANIIATNVIDSNRYDPEGLGVLIDIPTDFVTTHGIFYSPETNVTAIHYGQFLYDSILEAINSWQKESYNVVQELQQVPLMGVLVIKQGATDLSNPMQAVFIKPSKFGINNNVQVPEYSRYAGFGRALAGMSYRRQDIEIIEESGSIYAEIEKLGGGDMIFIFGDREYILDCTNGTGTNGKARIELTQGTATSPQINYIYAIPTVGNGHAELQASTSYPTGEISIILDCAIQDSASFLVNGSFAPRRWTDSKEFSGRSSIARTNEWIRRQPATYESGLLQTLTIDTVPDPDSVIFSVTSGIGWQKHRQSIPALSVATNGIYILNHPTQPYTRITNLNNPLALVTSSGVSMSDTRFNWVILIDVGKSASECKLYLNLPTDTYSVDQSAVDDPNNYSVLSIPEFLRGKALLNARIPIRHRPQNGGSYENLAQSILGLSVIDLRGQLANVGGGATSPPLGNSFEDALFNIFNTLAGFNFRFDASQLTADRIFTAPNKNGTLALLSDIKSIQNFQMTITGNSNFQDVLLDYDYGTTNYTLLINSYDTDGYFTPVRRGTKSNDRFQIQTDIDLEIEVITILN